MDAVLNREELFKMTSSVRDPNIEAVSDLVLQHGGHITHGTITDERLIVAEFDQAGFSFTPPSGRAEPLRLNWYSNSLPFSTEVFDKVNDDHRRRGEIVAGDYKTLLERLPGVLAAVNNGFAFAH